MLNILGYILASLVFIQPILFIPWLYSSFELPKALLLYFCGGLIILTLLSYKIIFNKPHQMLVYIFLTLFFVWVVITSLTGINFTLSFWGSYFRFQGLLSFASYLAIFLAGTVVLQDLVWQKRFSLAVIFSSLFVSILSLVEFVMLWVFGHSTQLLYANRVISTFGQPNFFAAFLVQALPFYWFMHRKARVGILVAILGILSSLSRSALVGLVFLGIFWSIGRIRMFVALLAAILIGLLLIDAFLPKVISGEMRRYQFDLQNKWTAENRTLILKRALELTQAKPLTGFGIENFSYVFPKVIRPNDFGLNDIVVDSSHNMLVDLAVGTGYVGLGLFLIFIFRLGHLGIGQGRFAQACLFSAVSYIIVHQFSVVSVVPTTLFWLSCAGILEPIIKDHVWHRFGKIRIAGFLAGCILMGLIVVFIIFSMLADYKFKQASMYEVSDIKKAISLDKQAIKLAPWFDFYKNREGFLRTQLGE